MFATLPKLSVKPFWPRSRLAKGLCTTVLMGGYFTGMGVLGMLATASKGMPNADTFYTPNRPISVQFVDRRGRDLGVRGAAEMKPAKLDRLPSHLVDAVISIEDRRFFSHSGVDPIGLLRAAVKNIEAGRVVEGGSTLTQQLVKNVFLTSDQTLTRKLQEMMLAIWVEHEFTKTEIIEAYLSRVYFGGGAWGVEAAAKTYFDKEGADLTVAESALLAGLLKAPSSYNPAQHPRRSAARTATVLSAMSDNNRLDRWAHYTALSEPIKIAKPAIDGSENYFIDWIWDEMVAAIGTPARDIVVETTLDKVAQAAATRAVTAHLDPERNAREAAVITLDGAGAVHVMVGGRSYKDSQFNRAAQAMRQPGSAFKPFVYLTAFDAGITPWDTRIDAPVTLGDWTPRNFTKDFKGEISLSSAFAQSINTVAIALTEEVGRDAVINTARRLGAGEFTPLRSIALGAQEMTPLTLTSAYQPFASAGLAATPYGIVSISTAQGELLYSREAPAREKVISEEAIGHMGRIMTETVMRGSGRRAQIAGRDIGGKTGTTNDFRDAWFIGYVPDLVTGVWVGADDATSMRRVTGGSIPADIWHDTMTEMLATRPLRYIPVSQKPLVEFSPAERQEAEFNLLLADIANVLPPKTKAEPPVQ